MNETLSEKLRSFGISLNKTSLAKEEKQDGVNFNGNPKTINFAFENDFSIINLVHEENISQEYDRIKSKVSHHNIDFSFFQKLAKYESKQSDFLSSVIFLDTETTGLAGGTGTLVFLVGFGFFTQNKFQIRQYFLKNPSNERQFLESILTLIDPRKIFITYNGRTFDIPLLNTRCILNRLESPLMSINHFDLLRLTRKLWRNSFKDCSLSHLEHKVLGIERNQEEIPGWLIPEVYRNYLQSGNDTDIRRVVCHNSSDILSLAGLFLYSSAYLTNPALFCKNEFELFAVADIYRNILNWNEAFHLFEKCFIKLDVTQENQKLFEKYGDLCKKYNHLDQAKYVWQKLAELDDIQSMVNLAKYYEHFKKDFWQSLYWTEKAIGVVAGNESTFHQHENLDYRKNRLLRRLRMNDNIREKLSQLKEKIRAQKTYQISPPQNSSEILNRIYSLLYNFDQIVTENAIKTLQGEIISFNTQPDPSLEELLHQSIHETDFESSRILIKYKTYKEKLEQMADLINSLKDLYIRQKVREGQKDL